MMFNTILILLIGGMVWSVATAWFGVFVINQSRGERVDWLIAGGLMSTGGVVFGLCVWKFTTLMVNT